MYEIQKVEIFLKNLENLSLFLWWLDTVVDNHGLIVVENHAFELWQTLIIIDKIVQNEIEKSHLLW